MAGLVDFFTDLEQNQAARAKLQGLGNAQFNALKLQAADADIGRGFVVVNPVGTAHLTAADGVGVVNSYYTDNYRILAPSALRKMANGEIWVSSNTTSSNIAIARFDVNFTFLGYWGRSSAVDGVYQTTDFVVDETARRLYTVGDNHVLRCFNLDTHAMLWQFGTPAQPLDLPTGLYNPRGIELLQNGNVVVSAWFGKAVGALGAGHISEFDPTGALVATHVSNITNRISEPWIGSIRHPDKIRIDAAGLLYVALYSDDIIAAYDTTAATGWVYTTAYTKPSGLSAGLLNPRGLYISTDHNQIIIGATSPRAIAALDLTSHDLMWVGGKAAYDAGNNQKNRPNEIWGCTDILEISAGRYLIADSGNHRLTVISNDNTFAVAYDTTTAAVIPTGWQLTAVALPAGYDAATHILTVALADAAAAGALYLPIERINA